MAGAISVPYHIVADPGEEAEEVIYTVPGGRRFVLKKLHVFFPAGTKGELEIRIYHGNMPVVPAKRPATGDDIALTFECKHEYDAGSYVTVRYKNTSSSEVREAFIVVHGELLK